MIQVRCSKGTYIRVLAEDIGAALGCGASLSALTRTQTGLFDAVARGMSARWARLRQCRTAERLRRVLPVDAMLKAVCRS